MTIESPTRSDTIAPDDGLWMTPRSREERHQRAVAQTLRWAHEAAAGEAYGDALEWLRVIEVVDGALTPGWERTQTSWRLLVAQQR